MSAVAEYTTQTTVSTITGPSYFLIIEGRSSRLHQLPDSGEVLIGRSLEAGIRLDDDDLAASRRHARLCISPAEIVLWDMDSDNGSFVNNLRISGSRELFCGDCVRLGQATLILQKATATLARKEPADERSWRSLRGRLAQEIEHARYVRSPLSLLLLHPGSAGRDITEKLLAQELRPLDMSFWLPAGQALLLLPELDEEDADLLARRLLEGLGRYTQAEGWPRVAIANCPGDGQNAEVLLAEAQAALKDAPAGQVQAVSQRRMTLPLRDGTLITLADPKMIALFEQLVLPMAENDLPILIQGETGTGKELVARALHDLSPSRRDKALVSVSCAAMPKDLAESELFGHKKGAFTGSATDRVGLIKQADGGTLFLDEIDKLPMELQSKLLRVLETHRFRRVGSDKEEASDFRLVAAAASNLREAVEQRRFFPDLLYRINTITLMLPPLRDRPRDIPVLARALTERECHKAQRAPLLLSAEAVYLLLEHDWPGNLRELDNVIRVGVARVKQAEVIEAYHLWPAAAAPGLRLTGKAGAAPRPLMEEVDELIRRRVQDALKLTGNNVERAAEVLGLPRRTLFHWLQKGQHGLTGGPPR